MRLLSEELKDLSKSERCESKKKLMEVCALLIQEQRTDLNDYESKLDTQSAYIEELKGTLKKQLQVTGAAMSQLSKPSNSISDISLIAMVEVVGKKSESVLNQSPTTSLEQVKRDYAYKAVMGILDMNYVCETPTGDNAYSETQIIEYANNLKEKGL